MRAQLCDDPVPLETTLEERVFSFSDKVLAFVPILAAKELSGLIYL